ncbi:DEKNAAC104234 [Brettanomyces naardenensis]|uniref:DEKNAAC104234 n=1 Tax=Brettanomyces naardenensis TaxID=13370 RepID=A0A448YPW5_BRENA|nr:DEKNAAC104234 [Brettanomyces naardenensis]
MSIAIIGGGPGGLAVAKALTLEPNSEKLFPTIDVYERHPRAGGLWVYTGDKSHVSPVVPSPSNAESDEIFANTQKRYISPIYDQMETNITKHLMKYKGFPFPEEFETFPTRTQIGQYVDSYAQALPDLVKFHFSTDVTGLLKKDGKWELTYDDLTKANGEPITKTYDNVVLAQGHFEAAYIPDVKGLKEWWTKDPKSITHAKYYNNGEPFRGKNVLVVGNSASGIDIATQLITTAKSVTMSSASESPFKEVIISHVTQVGKIAEYDYATKSAVTEDGTVVKDIDNVIFCTGYLYKIPFLNSYDTGDKALVSDGSQLRYLFEQIFYIEDPTLALVLVPQSVIPFPFAECQAQYIARVFSGRLKLPSKEKMTEEYEEELERKGAGKAFHTMKNFTDPDYCNHIFDLIKGTENEGFVAEYWSDERKEERKNAVALKGERLKLIVKHADELKKEGKPFTLLRNN